MATKLTRTTVGSAVSYVYSYVSDDESYIQSKTEQFISRACNHSGIPSNKWLAGELTEEAVKDVAYGMLDAHCSKMLMRLLQIYD